MKKFDVEKHKIGIATHSYGCISPAVYENHSHLFALWGRNYNICSIFIDGVKVARARNQIVKHAFEHECDYLLFIDADHICPDDMLMYLLGDMETCDVCSGVVCKRSSPHEQVCFTKQSDGYIRHDLPFDGKVYAVDICAFGATMINMDVFKDMKEPYFKDVQAITHEGDAWNKRSDFVFCEEVREMGKVIRMNTNVIIGHETMERKIIYPDEV